MNSAHAERQNTPSEQEETTHTQGFPPCKFSTSSLFLLLSLANSAFRYVMTKGSTLSGVMFGTSRIENFPETWTGITISCAHGVKRSRKGAHLSWNDRLRARCGEGTLDAVQRQRWVTHPTHKHRGLVLRKRNWGSSGLLDVLVMAPPVGKPKSVNRLGRILKTPHRDAIIQDVVALSKEAAVRRNTVLVIGAFWEGRLTSPRRLRVQRGDRVQG